MQAGWRSCVLLFEEGFFEKEHSPFVAAVMLIHSSSIPSRFEHLKKFFLGLDNAIVVEPTNNNCESSLLRDSLSIVLKIVEHHAYDACLGTGAPYLERIYDNLEPIELKTRSCIVEKDVKAWSSEKVMLFGRTGSGKSTVAQMLTRNASSSDNGSSSNISGLFEASSNARGVTKDIERGEGRGWHVTDTPGFGEGKVGSTVSTEQATKIIKQFVMDTCGTYSHYLYVLKKDRINEYDERLWKFFKKAFAGAENNISVVVTGCMSLSFDNRRALERIFDGCEERNIIPVDFPPVRDDSELEEENVQVRQKALEELEGKLEERGLADKAASIGEYSTESLRYVEGNRANSHGCGDKLDGLSGRLYNSLVAGPVHRVKGKFQKFQVDEKFILLPL